MALQPFPAYLDWHIGILRIQDVSSSKPEHSLTSAARRLSGSLSVSVVSPRVIGPCAWWGNGVAPLLTMILAYPCGWRIGFVFMSALGLAWLRGFHTRFRNPPQADMAVNDADIALISEGRGEGHSHLAPG
jgi:hypothetical protein